MTETGFTIAPLKNVALCAGALERAISRQRHLPGMVVFHGPSGFGKSFAACYVAGKHHAVYVECKSTWTRKATLTAIAKELGLPPTKTLYDLTEQVSEGLALSGRPLIVDEMDHLADRRIVEIIRDLYEGSQAPILLIGEERLPSKLKQWERFHGRILDFVGAQAADADDARVLAGFYCRGVSLGDDLLAELAQAARGSIRRICVNLSLIEETARGMGKKVVDLAAWVSWKKGFWTGYTQERSFR